MQGAVTRCWSACTQLFHHQRARYVIIICTLVVVTFLIPGAFILDGDFVYETSTMPYITKAVPNISVVGTDEKMSSQGVHEHKQHPMTNSNLGRTSAMYQTFPIDNTKAIQSLVSKTCPLYAKVSQKLNVFLQPWTQFLDIILIVTFNELHAETIPYLETLYRSFFPRIIYCLPDDANITDVPELAHFHFTFVEYIHKKPQVQGHLNYMCLQRVDKLQLRNFSGYLVVSDDVLLMVHTLNTYPKDVVWFEKKYGITDVTTNLDCRQRGVGRCNVNFHRHTHANSTTTRALKKLKNHSSPLYSRCHNQLVRITHGEQRNLHALSDFTMFQKR